MIDAKKRFVELLAERFVDREFSSDDEESKGVAYLAYLAGWQSRGEIDYKIVITHDYGDSGRRLALLRELSRMIKEQDNVTVEKH